MSSATTSQNGVSRAVAQKVYATEVAEGAGATVRRSIGSQALRNLSPFLMLDDATIKRGAGFPDHPHRGQTTVSYAIQGSMQHEDFLGNRGNAGDVQWMTAGKGIVHSEMPFWEDGDDTPVRGLQLWVDLPADQKFCEPSYQEKKGADIDRVSPSEGVDIVVISGESHGTTGFVRPVGGCWYLDFKLSKPGATVFQAIPKGWTAFIYILDGQISINGQTHDKHNTLVLTSSPDQEGVQITRPESSPDITSRFVLIAGEPLDQKVVQYGPFVLNNDKQVRQAFMDFQLGMNGFERAPGWRSEIGREMH